MCSAIADTTGPLPLLSYLLKQDLTITSLYPVHHITNIILPSANAKVCGA